MSERTVLTPAHTIPAAPEPVVPADPQQRLLRAALYGGCALTVVAAVLLTVRLLPAGSRSGRWVYPYVGTFSGWHLWPAAAALLAVVGLLLVSRRLRPGVAVGGWLVAAVPLQLLLRTYDEVSLSVLVASDRANSFHTPSLTYSAHDFISRYMEIVSDLPPHARTNMPGKTLLYHLLGAVTTDPGAQGVLVVAVSSLTALLVYAVAREVFDDHRTALYALILTLLMPGRLWFLPILNTVSPVPILLALWLHLRFLRGRQWPWAVAVGLTVYLTFLFEPLPLVLGLAFIGTAALALHRRTCDWYDMLRLVSVTLAAFAAAYLGMRALFGYDLFVNLDYVLADANDFNVRAARPYGVWVWRNLWDLALCAGLAVTVLVGATAYDGFRRGLARPAAVLTVCGLAVLAFLDLVGVNRGETIRLWIFLGVFFQLSAAWLCARSPRQWPFTALVAATLLQGTLGMALIAFVRP
ncbi:glycosyltransferase family 39 protein [Catellatospora sp. KI3]|uniref:glycosyltransferase family 39 protein n=1 Tax=Catellatospora sp. KI3 TaxID=3041620 RepID=UPI002482E133|nr:glycosyltransferase family 39 protein [Catellatospora sp. KI3]MDI1466006.1 glycosyltransferase family 39 protein [Catellatospora sp. KI3]